MDGTFKEVAEALFHLAQVYEFCAACEGFRTDDLYKDVLLELADKLIDTLRGKTRRQL